MLTKVSQKPNTFFDKFTGIYSKMLAWTLKHRAFVIIFVVALMGLSIYWALSMGTAFIPDMETPQMSVSIGMPKEATFEDTTQISDTVIERIMGIQGIETIGAFQSGLMDSMGGGGGSNGNSVSLYLLLDENKKISNADIEKQIYGLTEDLDCDIKVSTSNMDMSALGGSGIEVMVKEGTQILSRKYQLI